MLLSAGATLQSNSPSPAASISGTVYNDQNHNGAKDPGETPLANWQVYVDLQNDGLFDYGDPSAVTDASGHYTITGVPAGTYPVRQIVQDGYTQTSPVNFAAAVTVGPGQSLTYDFGDYQNAGNNGFNFDFTGNKSAVQPDGKIVVVGYNGTRSVIARYYPDGTPDTTFGGTGEIRETVGGISSQANDVLIDPYGNIIVAGSYQSAPTGPSNYSTSSGYFDRFTAAGQSDPVFQNSDPGFWYGDPSNPAKYHEITYSAISAGANGVILMTSNSWDYDTTTATKSNGEVSVEFWSDTTGQMLTNYGNFGGYTNLVIANGSLAGGGAAVNPDGSFWLAGSVTYNGRTSFALYGYDTQGVYDGSKYTTANYLSNSNDTALNMAIQPDGNLVVAGYTDNGNGNDDFTVLRLTQNDAGQWVPDATFGNNGWVTTDFGGDDRAQSVAILPNGDIFVAGTSKQGQSLFAETTTYSPLGALLAKTDLGATAGSVSSIRIPKGGVALFSIGSLEPLGGLQPVLTPGGTKNAPPAENVAPAGSLGSASDVTTAGGSSYLFKVEFTDPGQVDLANLRYGNVQVAGPNGYQQLAYFAGLDPGSTATDVVANYQIIPPGGTWTSDDNSNGVPYQINLQANQVSNGFGSFASSGPLGTFNVNVPPPPPTPPPPPATPPNATFVSASSVNTPGSSAIDVNVNYTDAQGIDFSSLSNANLSLALPGNTTENAASVSAQPATGPATSVVVDYQFPAPAGGWSFMQDGTYAISLGANQVYNLARLAAAGTGAFGTYRVTIPPPPPPPAGAPIATLVFAATITSSGTGMLDVKVRYHDATGINLSSLGDANLAIGLPGGGTEVAATFTSTPASSANTDVVVDYQFAGPPGGWSSYQDGNYPISLEPNQVFNVGHVAADGASTFASYAVNIVRPVQPNPVTFSGTVLNGITYAPLASAVVFLDANQNGALDAGEVSTTSDSQGRYTLTGLSGTTYRITEVPPSGMAATVLRGSATVTGTTSGSNPASLVFADIPVTATSAAADLKTQVVGAMPGSIVSGGKGRVMVRVTNAGTAKAVGPTDLVLIASPQSTSGLGGTLLTTLRVSLNLLPGRSRLFPVNFKYPAATTPSNDFLLASVNSSGAIPETDFTNNVSSSAAAVQVVPAFVDFTGAFAGAVPAKATIGKPLVLHVAVQNLGDDASAGDLAFSLSAGANGSSTVIGTADGFNGGIQPRKRRVYAVRFTVPSGFTPGGYSLSIQINPLNAILESNTDNNTITSGTSIVFA